MLEAGDLEAEVEVERGQLLQLEGERGSSQPASSANRLSAIRKARIWPR